ncbi:FtsZ family protein CetZ, type III [Natronomonas pharaonis DSM 2160]|uniref:Tubulin-like protein CetZ n=1 Tax=Natronomonas pharaonis (strain ATCC 35678 / DSM 2160 / CIP 103997 / JCM 8858 / NBRC 14720 / NCIMB 2260 / Gabara) TaxID=348780 RepID=Q3IRT7_NATPD|nr:tubulin/FtsZ family protein [Natronomonas pharaonis]CAI49155.1 FtsZ family protein CetZ, type III [Natronomonas pharaonis DSM 2160]
MKLVAIGAGQAGGKVLDRLLEHDARHPGTFLAHAVAVNTAEPDLQALDAVPEESRLLIGQSTVGGHGTGTDPETGRECAREAESEIQSAIDHAPTSSIDGFVVIAGLGGGTGSGAAPVIAERLRAVYAEPVYGLGILPTADEGGLYSRNAADSLQAFVGATDGLLVFDNDAFKSSGETLSEGYGAINEEIATRFGTLFSAGELEALGDDIAESVVDASEIINTLEGLVSVGYASEELPDDAGDDGGLLGRVLGGSDDDSIGSDAVVQIPALVRRAALGKLTLPCNLASTSKALLIVAGPPEHLSRKGIDNARSWLESEIDCREVRAGDYPLPDADRVAALVVLSGVTDVPRIDRMQSQAVDAETAETSEAESEDAMQDLIEYGDDSDGDGATDGHT